MITRHILMLCLALIPFGSLTSFASELEENTRHVALITTIEADMAQKVAEINVINKKIDAESADLQRLQKEKFSLEREKITLEAEKDRSKAALDKQYSRLLNDPKTNISSFQEKYQADWSLIKNNQTNLLINNQSLMEIETSLSQSQQIKERLHNEYEQLEESYIVARVERMNTELGKSDTLETSYVITCSTQITLRECANQGKSQTKHKAIEMFKEQLLAKLTESDLAQKNAEDVQFNIYIQEVQLMKNSFSGNNLHSTQIQAKLQARPEATAACKLLNINSRYCLKDTRSSKTNEDKKWVNITVRSNQHNDSVVVNGIKYGSTPTEIVLLSGRHKISVSKKGYKTYNQVITVNKDDTIWVKLLPNE